MALQPVVKPWPSITSASKLFHSARSTSSYDTGEVWRHFLLRLPPFKLGLPTGRLSINPALVFILMCFINLERNIVKEIKQYQEKWLQHVQRTDTNRIPKQALQYQPKGRRNIGRPRKRWRDQLHLED